MKRKCGLFIPGGKMGLSERKSRFLVGQVLAAAAAAAAANSAQMGGKTGWREESYLTCRLNRQNIKLMEWKIRYCIVVPYQKKSKRITRHRAKKKPFVI